MDLNPVKSYKVVVLQTLPALPGTTWEISSIARGFTEFYLKNPTKRHGYDELDKSARLEDFPLVRVSARLKAMPLHFLSNTDKDFFILDKKAGMFCLKDEYIPFWRDETFRKLLREQVFSQPDRAGLQTRQATLQMAESPRSGRALRGLKKDLPRKGKTFFASRIR